jgi:hypothetical protein
MFVFRLPFTLVGWLVDRLFPPDPEPYVGCWSNEEIKERLPSPR